MVAGSSFPFWWNRLAPAVDCKSMPTRLVPFAMSAGMPNIIKAGKVSIEPPPAIVLMNPAKMPEIIKRETNKKLNSYSIMILSQTRAVLDRIVLSDLNQDSYPEKN
jgi:hypothetical protein